VSPSVRELAKPHVRDLEPYPPGKPIREVERELGLASAIKLASNESPIGPSPRAIEALQAALPELHRYPDGSCFYLRQALAKKLGVSPQGLIFGAGADELLEFAVKAFVGPGDEVVFPWPSFAMYPIVARGMGGRPVPVSLDDSHQLRVDALLAALTPRTRVVFIANPNNPTGRAVGCDSFDALVAGLPAPVLLVCDEAYREYVRRRDYPDSLALSRVRPMTMVLRTFSKAYGLAGLRIGYAIGDPELIGVLERTRHPFNVNSLAQAAAEAALADDAHLSRVIELTHRSLAQLEEGLRAFGFACTPSDANFVLAEIGPQAAELEKRLLQRGIITRSLRAFGLDRHLRVTAGLPEENEQFLSALREELGR
jgi:histidinol-phosphate aminotransferase